MENRYLCKGRPVGTRKKWVIGFYAVLGEKTVIIEKEPEKYHDIEAGKSGCGNRIVEVMPETVCQCTGIKDKKGRMIFENDILEAHLDDKFPDDVYRTRVIWEKNGWVTSEPGAVDKEYLDEFDTENYAVVGNIFDNPELLEE